MILKFKDGVKVGQYADRNEAKIDLGVKGQIINLHLMGKVKLVNGFVLREVEDIPEVLLVTPPPPTPEPAEPEPKSESIPVIDETQLIIPTDFHLTAFEKLLKRGSL